MATQRIIIAKVVGVASEVIWQRLFEWGAERQANDIDEWSYQQWNSITRLMLNKFVYKLRKNSLQPPVVYFVEWIDQWSMGDIFLNSFLHKISDKVIIMSEKYEVYAYFFDKNNEMFSQTIKNPNKSRNIENVYYHKRLLEAVESLKVFVDRAIVVVIREVSGGLVTDGEIIESMAKEPGWVSRL